MDFRIATLNDLQKLKVMYCAIVKNMYANNLKIWDDVYPVDFLENDIINEQLYVLVDENEVVAAFALCDKALGSDCVQWANPKGKALYLDRLGVNVSYTGKGIASKMIDEAKTVARQKGCEYLRLFVVDENMPAVSFYEKNNFRKANGVYDEVIDDDLTLHEYGYEAMLFVEGEPHSFDDLKHIVHTLRDKERGCSWDNVQTHESLKKCLIDETNEVISAIDNKDDKNLCEELGDVMLNIMLQAKIAEQRGAFSFQDVIQTLADKMIRRHPHVFGDEPRPENAEDALLLWRKIKEIEKKQL